MDNGSTDGSPNAVKERFPTVKLICNKSNLGFARANNLGIAQSDGRYICLVNSDIQLLDGCIRRMCAYMDERPSIGMLGPKILNPDLSLRPNCQRFPNLWNTLCQALILYKIFPYSSVFSDRLMRDFPHDVVRDVEVLPGCFWMVRREAINLVGLLDEDFLIYSEDLDWCRRFWEAGWRVVFTPGAEVIHFAGASSSRQPVRFHLERLRASLHYWKKHHGQAQQLCFLLIMMLHYSIRFVVLTPMVAMNPGQRDRTILQLKSAHICLKWLRTVIKEQMIGWLHTQLLS